MSNSMVGRHSLHLLACTTVTPSVAFTLQNLLCNSPALCVSGVTFLAELTLNWNVAYVATHNLRKRIVLKRKHIANFYVYHSTFLFDLISTIVFIVQVGTW